MPEQNATQSEGQKLLISFGRGLSLPGAAGRGILRQHVSQHMRIGTGQLERQCLFDQRQKLHVYFELTVQKGIGLGLRHGCYN